MPRITISINQDALEAIDSFAEHVCKSRSVACASILEMVIPMLGYLKTTYDFTKSGDSNGAGEMLGLMDDLLAETRGEFESFKAEVLGVSGSANPRSCNNGGQVSPADLPTSPQPLVFLEEKPLTPPLEGQGGKNA